MNNNIPPNPPATPELPAVARRINTRLREQANQSAMDTGKRNKKNPAAIWKSHPDFLWSLRDNNPKLLTYLSHVTDGIKKAAKDLNLTLDKEDLSWTESYDGRYKQFIHDKSRDAEMIIKRECHQTLSLAQIGERVENKLHKILGESPRFKKKPATVSNYEGLLKLLWNFLAMIADYESMVILLPRPPPKCPSIKRESVALFVYHRYLPPLSPLTSNGTASGKSTSA